VRVPKEILPHGNELVKSDQHYCLVVDETGVPACGDRHEVQPVEGQPPLENADCNAEDQAPQDWCDGYTCGIRYDVASTTTEEESNDQGSWGNYQLPKSPLSLTVISLMEAKAFRESIMAGEVKAAKDPEHGHL
jgi:hypothetical protein